MLGKLRPCSNDQDDIVFKYQFRNRLVYDTEMTLPKCVLVMVARVSVMG